MLCSFERNLDLIPLCAKRRNGLQKRGAVVLSYLADFSVTGRLTGRLDQPAECFAETLRKRQGDLPSALQMTGWSEVMTMLSPISSASEVPAALMWRVPSST